MSNATNTITGGVQRGNVFQVGHVTGPITMDGLGASFSSAPADPALWPRVYRQALRIAADGGTPDDLSAWAEEQGLELR